MFDSGRVRNKSKSSYVLQTRINRMTYITDKQAFKLQTLTVQQERCVCGGGRGGKVGGGGIGRKTNWQCKLQYDLHASSARLDTKGMLTVLELKLITRIRTTLWLNMRDQRNGDTPVVDVRTTSCIRSSEALNYTHLSSDHRVIFIRITI